jgi:hypothetical protein
MGTEILWGLAMMVVSYLIQAAMAPKPKQPSVGQMDIPVAEEGASIPVIFGTVVVKDAQVLWYGDSSTTEITSDGGKK